jgi:large subunit ribosomal protein L24
MNKFKKGDEVIVTTGKYKNKVGTVLSIKADKILVEGIALIKKHIKSNPDKGIEGGIIEKESLIHISNVAFLNPENKKLSKIGFRVENGKKVRYLKLNGKTIE